MPAKSERRWRLADCLARLRAQVDAAFPERSRKSDGDIGDAAHASRASDHNPNDHGVVTAIDITHDPVHGFKASTLAEAIRNSKDFRVKYVIFAGRMFSSYPSRGTPAWTWRPYVGSNPHDKHIHISVYDESAPWEIA